MFFLNYNVWKNLKMYKDSLSRRIYNEEEVLDIVMRGIDIKNSNIIVDNISKNFIDNINNVTRSRSVEQYNKLNLSKEEFDKQNQKNWFMPAEYKNLDIAEYVLKLCNTQAELQRCGQELLMYQERNLFNLLQYLKYLVDKMKENNVIWGVGRGSSVSSYVLYKMEVHKVDSMYYNLDVSEFLR